MSNTSSGPIWVAVTAGVLAIVGGAIGSVFQGQANVELEQARRESQLILKALEPEDENARRDTLRFMVNSRLIKDESIIAGLEAYTRDNQPRSLPQVASATSTFVSANEADTESADVDLFVCESNSRDQRAIDLQSALADKLIASGKFGQIQGKIWGGNLFNEIGEKELAGKVSIIADRNHPEAKLTGVLEQAINSARTNLQIAQLANRGTPSPWRISVVICPW